MNKALIALTVAMVLAWLGLSAAHANRGVKSDEPAMMASPQTIVLAKVDAVTVHTNIPAADVDAATVTLNGVEAADTWADDLGHLAARFALADLELPVGEVTLTLAGSYAAGGSFAVDDVVNVK